MVAEALLSLDEVGQRFKSPRRPGGVSRRTVRRWAQVGFERPDGTVVRLRTVWALGRQYTTETFVGEFLRAQQPEPVAA